MAERLARTVMLQGASSSVGKSYLAAGLCRLYARRGLRVAPYKSQNMALNAAVTPAGEEIGRSQAVQAEAAGIPAEAAMNPILLKAEADSRCQVVLMGRAWGSCSAIEYRRLRARLWGHAEAALTDLRRRFDLVVIEGAGSPAEVNLRRGEIVNMRVAAAAEAPVLLVGDIERGGVFAALLGTLSLLRPAERARVRALIVNRFRGDAALFEDGVRFLERRSRRPVLGVVPFLEGVRLPAEDSLDLPSLPGPPGDAALDVAVVRLERISNFDELQPLAREPGVRLRLVARAADMGHPDLVVLPGTKTTAADLERLRAEGLAAAVLRARAGGTAVLGVCGGYQMLGRALHDPTGAERAGSFPGLRLLPVETHFAALTAPAPAPTAAPAPALTPTSTAAPAPTSTAAPAPTPTAAPTAAPSPTPARNLTPTLDDPFASAVYPGPAPRKGGALEGETGKVTVRRRGTVLPGPGLLSRAAGLGVEGYEIRVGRVRGAARPAFDLGGHREGCVSEDGWVVGTSVHGVLGSAPLRRAVLEALAVRKGVALPPPAPPEPDPFDALADALEAALDIAALDRIVGL